jgi:hypothetical protein
MMQTIRWIWHPEKEPSYVQKTLHETQQLLTQKGYPSVHAQPSDLVVRVGHAAHDDRWSLSPVRHDGFRLTRVGPEIRLAGRVPQGTLYGLLALQRQGLPTRDCDHVSNPVLGLRGMYAHTAWLYAYPYAVRSWTLTDWTAYIDWLVRHGFNLLQIWVPVGMMSVPPDSSDQAWLGIVSAASRYAQEQRGMTVWVGEAANNAVDDVRGVDFTQREYFRYCVGHLQNPQDARARELLAASRKTLYQTFAHADGFWLIDSDPGGWPGSPTEDFLSIVDLNAQLMSKYAKPDAQFVYWMWFGWGTQSPEENYARALHGIDHMIGSAHAMVSCRTQHLAVVEREGWAERAVLIPYGAIEGEPRYPYTRWDPDSLKTAVGLATAARLVGCVGNAQTPGVQWPQIAALGRYLWPREWAVWDYRTNNNGPPWERIIQDLSDEFSDHWREKVRHALHIIAGAKATDDGDLLGCTSSTLPDAPVMNEERMVRDLFCQVQILHAVENLRVLLSHDDLDRWYRAVRDWALANLRWHDIIQWDLAENIVEFFPPNQLPMVTNGRYWPGRGAYERYGEPVRNAVLQPPPEKRQQLKHRLLANPPQPAVEARWQGMIEEVFGP